MTDKTWRNIKNGGTIVAAGAVIVLAFREIFGGK
jgi:hypothetical protein